MATPKTVIQLINANYLDINIDHTVSFGSASAQYSWFISQGRLQKTITSNVYHRKGTPLRVAGHVDSLSLCNYAIVDNGTKKHYYFITSRNYINESTTELTLQLDLIQTYMFDWAFAECMIDRMHTNRNSMNVIEEDIQIGDYMIHDTEDICNLNEGSVIIASSDPLGYVASRRIDYGVGGGSTEGGATGGDPVLGICSAKMFRLIKQYEGFGQYPYYGGGEKFRTYGYGATETYQAKYFAMLGTAPVSEKHASDVLSDMLINAFGVPLANQLKKDGVDLARMNIQHFDVFLSQSMNAGLGSVASGKGVVAGKPYQLFISGASPQTVADAIKKWAVTESATGNVLPGLVKRRESEADTFLNGVYTFTNIGIVGGGKVTDNNGHGYIPAVHGDIYGSNVSNPDRPTFSNGAGKWILPADGTVKSLYGYRVLNGKPDNHYGVDIANKEGTPIYSVADGTVSLAQSGYGNLPGSSGMASYGNCIFIDHADTVHTRYAHLLSLKVKVGDKVKAGQLIGHMGNTGNSYGSHLHLEFHKPQGTRINPCPNWKLEDKLG